MSDLPHELHAPGHEVMEQAAGWFSLLQSGQATDRDRADWQVWLAGSDERRAAWAFVERVSERFAPLQAVQAPRLAADVLQTASRRFAKRRRLLFGGAAMAGCGGLLGLGVWQHTGVLGSVAVCFADQHTAFGERRDVVLADGTRVWLASASAFDKDYRADLRRLRLRSGEILIETVADKVRPFVVDTPQGRLRALGTRFNVRLDEAGRTCLDVFDGVVEVALACGTGRAVVEAGQQAVFTAGAVEARAAADPAREAWSRGVLLAPDISLAQVAAELGRYWYGHIAVAPDVAGLRVLGSYPLDDFKGSLSQLEQALPIRIRQPLPWWTVIEARHS